MNSAIKIAVNFSSYGTSFLWKKRYTCVEGRD